MHRMTAYEASNPISLVTTILHQSGLFAEISESPLIHCQAKFILYPILLVLSTSLLVLQDPIQDKILQPVVYLLGCLLVVTNLVLGFNDLDSLRRNSTECSFTGVCLLFFPLLTWIYSLEEEYHKSKMLFLSNLTYYQHDFSL